MHLKKAINQSDYFNEFINEKILMNYIISYEIDEKLISGSPIGNYAKNLNLNFYKLLVNQNIINTYQNLFKD